MRKSFDSKVSSFKSLFAERDGGPSVTAAVRRLKQLASRLADLKSCNFDMSTWVSYETCGTVGCIAGYAASEVPKELRGETGVTDGYKQHGRILNTRTGRYGYEAFADAFGLQDDVAYEVTHPDSSHRTPHQAHDVLVDLANRILEEDKQRRRAELKKKEEAEAAAKSEAAAKLSAQSEAPAAGTQDGPPIVLDLPPLRKPVYA